MAIACFHGLLDLVQQARLSRSSGSFDAGLGAGHAGCSQLDLGTLPGGQQPECASVKAFTLRDTLSKKSMCWGSKPPGDCRRHGSEASTSSLLSARSFSSTKSSFSEEANAACVAARTRGLDGDGGACTEALATASPACSIGSEDASDSEDSLAEELEVPPSQTCTASTLDNVGATARGLESRDTSSIEGRICKKGLATEPPLVLLCSACLPQSLNIRVCSWNLFGRTIAAADSLAWWLKRGHHTDVLVLGVQELVELRPRNVLGNSSGYLARLASLESRLEASLGGESGGFSKLCSVGMVGLATLVYVRKELAPSVRRLGFNQVKTGFGGALANKGGVRVHFALGGFSACFVNVHLPAGDGNPAKRDRHLRKILNDGAEDELACWSPWSSCERRHMPHNFTAVFGDLNSRVEPRTPESAAPGSTPAADLLERDELLRGRLPSLASFREGRVEFPPTFCYVPGTDTIKEGKQPAWCDRVLFKDAQGTTAELLEYDSFEELRHTSDHRPIAAQFRVSTQGDSVSKDLLQSIVSMH